MRECQNRCYNMTKLFPCKKQLKVQFFRHFCKQRGLQNTITRSSRSIQKFEFLDSEYRIIARCMRNMNLLHNKLMRFNRVKSTLIVIKSGFNRLLRFDSSSPIYRHDDFHSKSRSEFESNFEFGPRIVEFDRKRSNLNQKRPKQSKNRLIWLKFDQFSI